MQIPGSELHYLAGLYGIQTSYLDMDNRVTQASDTALLAVLKAVGAPVSKMEDVRSAILKKNREYWQQPVEPVLVVWQNEILSIPLRLPAYLIGTAAHE
jgi:4-alpha-glucanotransferase